MNDDDVFERPASRWLRRGVWAAIALAGVAGALVYRARPSNQPKTPAELLRVMQDPAATAADRHLAAAALGKTDGAAVAQVVPQLIAALTTGDDQVRFAAVMVLERLGAKASDAKPALIQATADFDPRVRQFAIRALSPMGPDAAAVAAFSTAARDANAEVRNEAFGALRFQQVAGAEALITLLGDDDADVRCRAASELSRLPSHVDRSGGPLRRVLAEDHDPRARGEALTALGELSLLRVEEWLSAFSDRDVRPTALKVVKRLERGGAVAVPELRRFLKSDDTELAVQAVDALKSIGPAARDAVDDLVGYVEDVSGAFNDAHESIGFRVGWALAAIGLEAQYKPPDLWARLAEAREDVKALVLRGDPVSRTSDIGDREMQYLAPLANLRYLDLSDTEVGDAGLADLAGLTKLEWLNLARTRVTSAGLAHLAGMSDLRMLQLSDCRVADDGLAQLKGLVKLENLMLRKTNVTDAGLAHLAGLRDLKTLLLGDTKVTDAGMSHLAGLQELTSLGLGGTSITDDGLKQLNEIDLSYLSFAPGQFTTDAISRFEHLTDLWLNDPKIGDAELAALSRLIHLKSLWLKDSSLSDEGLKHLATLTELTTLSLENTATTDAGLAPLHSLKNLKWIGLSKTRVTPAGIAQLKNALPDVQVRSN
jgi:internalin A